MLWLTLRRRGVGCGVVGLRQGQRNPSQHRSAAETEHQNLITPPRPHHHHHHGQLPAASEPTQPSLSSPSRHTDLPPTASGSAPSAGPCLCRPFSSHPFSWGKVRPIPARCQPAHLPCFYRSARGLLQSTSRRALPAAFSGRSRLRRDSDLSCDRVRRARVRAIVRNAELTW